MKDVKEASYEGEIKVDKVVGIIVKRRKYYYVAFHIGVIISHEDIK